MTLKSSEKTTRTAFLLTHIECGLNCTKCFSLVASVYSFVLNVHPFIPSVHPFIWSGLGSMNGGK